MVDKDYILIEEPHHVYELIGDIDKNAIIAYDVETTSLKPRKGPENKIIGFSISTRPGTGYYFPIYRYNREKDELEELEIGGVRSTVLARKIIKTLVGKRLVMHNGSFDCRYTKAFFDIDLTPSLWVDTILLVHTVQEEGVIQGPSKSFQLKVLARSIQDEIGFAVDEVANQEQIELKENIIQNGGKATKTQFDIHKADLPIIAKYAAADTDLTLRLCNYYLKILEREGLVDFFFKEEVMPLYKEVTIPMEEKGVHLDIPLLEKTQKEITQDLLKKKDEVLQEFMNSAEVMTWVIDKALTKFPPSPKGRWAQKLIEYEKIPLPKTSTGKYKLTKKEIENLGDGAVKSFLLDGNLSHLDPDQTLRISVDLWKEFNGGDLINVQSSKQWAEIVFDYMKIPPISYTDKGAPQFNDSTIEILAKHHKWARLLRIYRRLLKIKTTYVDRFLENQEDGKYYFYYKQHGTVSGRYGSDAQQLPKPKEEGEDDPLVIKYNNLVRAFLIAGPGRKIIDADYTSLEPMCFASISGDENLREIFKKGYDFYATVAIKTENLDQRKDLYPNGVSVNPKDDNFLKKIDPSKRNKAKVYSLGIAYGMEAYALGKTLDIPTNEAERLVEGYFQGFPKLRVWKENSRRQMKEKGYIVNKVGRVRHLTRGKKVYDMFGDAILDHSYREELSHKYGTNQVLEWYRDYKNALNNCLNFQLQSLAAAIVNRAAIQINRYAREHNIDAFVQAQIHDQLIINVREDQAEKFVPIVQHIMENTTKLEGVTLKAPPAIADNFRDGH